MVLGFGTITLRISGAHSLKEKRKVVQSILSRSKNRFNASISEVGFNDVHQRAQIGFAMTGNDRRVMNSRIDHLIEFIERDQPVEIIDTQMEIVNT